MNQLFFKINLNKYGELRRFIEREKKTFRNVVIVFAIALFVFSGLAIYINQDLNSKIREREALLSEIRHEIENYQESGEYLSDEDLNRLAEASMDRIFWAEKLVALSEKAHKDLAITHFAYKNGVLSLYGITHFDQEQSEFELIDDFIESLRQDEQISQDFPDIKFVNSRSDFEKGVQILRFQIDCEATS